MTNDIRDLLDALRDGVMGLDEVASRFKDRTWPRRRSRPPASYREMAAAEMQDPETFLPGSFDDVVEAYELGRLTPGQFRVLGDAVAQAQRVQDAGKDELRR